MGLARYDNLGQQILVNWLIIKIRLIPKVFHNTNHSISVCVRTHMPPTWRLCSFCCKPSILRSAGNKLEQSGPRVLQSFLNLSNSFDRSFDCSIRACNSSYQFCQASSRSDQSEMKDVSLFIRASFCEVVFGSASTALPRASIASKAGCLADILVLNSCMKEYVHVLT